MKQNEIVVYTDGGSRGNPGPAGIGVFISSRDKRYGEYIGFATNNVAEYRAMIYALKKVKQVVGAKKAKETHVEIRSDSQLVVNQLSGIFKVKEEELFPYFIEMWNLRQEFFSVRYTYIPREENKVADALVNEALDEATARKLW